MPESSPQRSREAKKDARIEYLERLAKWHLYSLELLASMGELYFSAGQDRNPDTLFTMAQGYLVKILKFDAMAFYQVAESDSEFSISYVWPEEARAEIMREVDLRIQDGSFSWAVNQNRSIISKCPDKNRNLVLHVLATRQRVRGMFAGFISTDIPCTEETLQYTLSLILQNIAKALESSALYDLFNSSNLRVEERVRERTSDLEDHLIRIQGEIQSRKMAEESLWEAKQEAETVLKVKGYRLNQYLDELKIPIKSIKAYADLITSEMESASFDKLNIDLDGLRFLGNDILSRIVEIQEMVQNDDSRQAVQVEAISIIDLLVDVSRALYPYSKKKSTEIKISPNKKPEVIKSDKIHLRQILLEVGEFICRFARNDSIRLDCLIKNEKGRDWICFQMAIAGEISQKDVDLFLTKTNDNESRESGEAESEISRRCRFIGGEIEFFQEAGVGSVIAICFPTDLSQSGNHPSLALRNLKTSGPDSEPERGTPSQKERIAVFQSTPGGMNRPFLPPRSGTLWIVGGHSAENNIFCKILKNERWEVLALSPSMNEIQKQEDLPHLIVLLWDDSSVRTKGFLDEWVNTSYGKSIPILIYSSKDAIEAAPESFPPQVKGVLQRGNCTRMDLIEKIENLLRDPSSTL